MKGGSANFCPTCVVNNTFYCLHQNVHRASFVADSMVARRDEIALELYAHRDLYEDEMVLCEFKNYANSHCYFM